MRTKEMVTVSDQRREVFSERLRAARTDRSMTQENLSDASGVAREMIARYENQRAFPAIETLIKLAQILGVTTDYLLGLTDDPQFEQPATIAARPSADMPPIQPDRLEEIIAEAVAKIRELSGKKSRE